MSAPFVSETDLQLMRARWAASAKESAVVTWPIEVDDGEGGTTDEGTNTSDPMPASIAPVSRSTAAQLEVQGRHLPEGGSVIYLPHDFTVPTRGRVVLNAVDLYEIVTPVPRRSNQVRRQVVVRYLGTVED